MDKSLFAFIWRHSKRDQLALLALTVISFPLLYVSLELPKRIINDAIGAETDNIRILGVTLAQEQYLLVLCLLFLAAVLASGLMKMRINTYKGIVSERMLRRLRYLLLTRLMRFPAPYFRTTSQGELVAMVTAEAEPMGGLMGDAVAQPVFQAGQMLTIVMFLFMQSVWFGLASIALIPLQAWLIPRLQRQINLLNKDRIVEVRHLASEIGETAAGISDLRANGGWRYRAALLSDRLGKLYEIRFRIYQKKFFMKFLNNFITHLTPFFFYLVGGYLTIQGEISVGALVAGLAAYKDIAGPWRELLTYYNQVQDMSLRWTIVTERFAPEGIIDSALMEDVPDEIPRLQGPIELRGVTVNDQDGNVVLQDISLDIPAGSRIAIEGGTAIERAAIAGLLTREITPSRGTVRLAGQDILTLHQAVIAARVGYAHSQPYLFDGTIAQNLLMPFALRTGLPGVTGDEDDPVAGDPMAGDHRANEATRSGGSADPLDAPWLDPGIGGFADRDDLGSWWYRLIRALRQDEAIFRRALEYRIDPVPHHDLAQTIVALRPVIWQRLCDLGLDDVVHRFDPDAFNPAIPLAGNVLFAIPRIAISNESMTRAQVFAQLVREEGLAGETLNVGQSIMTTLHQTFGRDGTDHPLFRRLGLDEDLYLRLLGIVFNRRVRGDGALSNEERLLLMTVPFTLTAEQIGPGFPDRLKEKILSVRKMHREALLAQSGDMFEPIAPDRYLQRLTVLENALYGRVSLQAGARAEEIRDAVADLLTEEGLRWRIARLVFDLDSGIGGANLPHTLQERMAFGRAVLKRPDILVFDRVLASYDSEERANARDRLRELLPDATMIFMEARFRHPEDYDQVIELKDGRIDGADQRPDGSDGDEDFRNKLRIIARTDLFAMLDNRHQRLLAFSAQWYETGADQEIFRTGQPADAAYLCVKGAARLHWPGATPRDRPVTIVEPGRLIGDLAIIRNEPRRMDLVTTEPSLFLRIGAREFRDVIESDATVAVSLLETVAGHLMNVVGILDRSGIDMNKLGADADDDPPDETAVREDA